MPLIANHNQMVDYTFEGKIGIADQHLFETIFNVGYDLVNSGDVGLELGIEPNDIARYYNNLEIFNTFYYWALKSYMKNHNEKTNFFFKDVDFFLSKNNPLKITQVFMQRPGIGEIAVQRAFNFLILDFYDYIYGITESLMGSLDISFISRTIFFNFLRSEEKKDFSRLFSSSLEFYMPGELLGKYNDFYSIMKWYQSTTTYARMREALMKNKHSIVLGYLNVFLKDETSSSDELEKIDSEGKHVRVNDILYDADTLLSKFRYLKCDYNIKDTTTLSRGQVFLFPSENFFECSLKLHKKHLWELFISPDAAIHLVLPIDKSEGIIRATEEDRRYRSLRQYRGTTTRFNYWRTETGDFRNLAKFDFKSIPSEDRLI